MDILLSGKAITTTLNDISVNVSLTSNAVSVVVTPVAVGVVVTPIAITVKTLKGNTSFPYTFPFTLS